MHVVGVFRSSNTGSTGTDAERESVRTGGPTLVGSATGVWALEKEVSG
jgi:hypothetical protein